mmetsp:Transcript_3329/g.8556  ORF Transcript_3329/g.8556 Transcript_3329/m.8556 type:complete len:237 (-) Transcript_3329:200-910(-)
MTQALGVANNGRVGIHADLVRLAGVVTGTALVARQAVTANIVLANAVGALLVRTALVRIKAGAGPIAGVPHGLEAGVSGAGCRRPKVHQQDARLGHHGLHDVEGAHEEGAEHGVRRVEDVAPLDGHAVVDRDKIVLVQPELGKGERHSLARGGGDDPVAHGTSVVDVRQPLQPALGPAGEGRAVGEDASGLGEHVAHALSAAPGRGGLRLAARSCLRCRGGHPSVAGMLAGLLAGG